MPTSKHSIGYGNGETQHDERSIPVNVHYEKYNIISDVLHWKICEYGNQQTVKQARKQKPGTDYNLYDCIVALVKIVQNLNPIGLLIYEFTVHFSIYWIVTDCLYT